jgi:hypothetical protein
MSLYQWPCHIDLELRSDVPRPDGPVPLRINGPALLAAVGASGHLDFRSLRLADRNLFQNHWGSDSVERDVAVQFVPDTDFDPVSQPCGTLWFHLFKYSWEDKAFPRTFRLYFDTVVGGGKPAWSGQAEPQRPFPILSEISPGQLEWKKNNQTALAYNAPWSGKPHFHPITTPAGRTLTADRPRDHIWHHGLCFGWTNISCPAKGLKEYAFWGEPGGAVIYTKDVSEKASGPVVSEFRSDSICCTQAGEPVFDMSVKGRYQSIDIGWDWLDIELTLSARDEPVTFSSEYGHLKVRLSMDFQDPVILDSTGKSESDNPYRQPTDVDWIGLSGHLEGAPAAMLLLNHPDNPGGRPSGDGSVCRRGEFFIDEGALFAWISLNPMRVNPIRITAGSSLTWKYRIVTTDRLLSMDFNNYQYTHWMTPWQISGLP